MVCPNLGEAVALTGVSLPVLVEDPARACPRPRGLEGGAAGVVLKGGHGREDPLRELVWEREERPPGSSGHGLRVWIRGSAVGTLTSRRGRAQGRPLEDARGAGPRVATLLGVTQGKILALRLHLLPTAL